MEAQRRRHAERERTWYNPEVRARWAYVNKLARYGLTQETYGRLLEVQGNACGMCHEPFKEGRAIFIDHDHTHCTTEKSGCVQCVRGLLCPRCNTGLGYIERMYGLARVYLDKPLPLVGPPASRGG
jgi:hypothetical protein